MPALTTEEMNRKKVLSEKQDRTPDEEKELRGLTDRSATVEDADKPSDVETVNPNR